MGGHILLILSSLKPVNIKRETVRVTGPASGPESKGGGVNVQQLDQLLPLCSLMLAPSLQHWKQHSCSARTVYLSRCFEAAPSLCPYSHISS